MGEELEFPVHGSVLGWLDQTSMAEEEYHHRQRQQHVHAGGRGNMGVFQRLNLLAVIIFIHSV